MTAADFCHHPGPGGFTRRFAAIWRDIDVLMTPALAGPPPSLLGAFHRSRRCPRNTWRGCCFLAVYRDVQCDRRPALVIPVRRSMVGLPVGVQLAAPLGGDRLLLQLAAQMEAALPGLGRAVSSKVGLAVLFQRLNFFPELDVLGVPRALYRFEEDAVLQMLHRIGDAQRSHLFLIGDLESLAGCCARR